LLGDRAGALMAGDRGAVYRRYVDGVARGVLGDVPAGGVEAVAALQRGDRRLQARGDEELDRREHAPVDLAAADVDAPALVDGHVRVGKHSPCQGVLGHQEDLADRRPPVSRAEERVAAGRAVDRGRLEPLPAVEDRLVVDPGSAATGWPPEDVEV